MFKRLLLVTVMSSVAVFAFAQRPEKTGKLKLISHTEVGMLRGNPDDENSAPFIFHSSLNCAFHRNLSAGIGAGLEFLKEAYLPVMANVLYQFGNKKVITPFVRLQAGYQAPLESNTVHYPVYYPVKLDARGGFMTNPSVGVIVYTRTGLGISLSAGYRYQRLTYKGDKDYALHIEYNRLSLTSGIIF